MKDVKYLNDFENKMGFYIEEYEENNNISLITDYEIAKEIYDLYSDEYYEDYVSINLQSDVDGYLVEIANGELFVIEPVTRNGNYFTIETNKLIIEEEFLNNELKRFLDYNDILIISTNTEIESDDCEDEEFTVEDLCSYVLINKLDNCKNMQEEIEVLKELYDIGFDDGYNKAIQDDIEFKMDFLNED